LSWHLAATGRCCWAFCWYREMEVTGAVAVSMHDWEALQRLIAGDVVFPGSAAYEKLPKPFNARFHGVQPLAVVRCATPQDVAEAVLFVGRHGLECATRSGGHCFAGRSVSRGVVIDVSLMDSVSASGGVATVGAGTRLGRVYESLEEHGLALPAGTCPLVGVAGLTLGGGLGILGRKYGLTSDRLMSVQIVPADGRLVDCDDSREGDLFWALRGAGAGNFGAVTSLVFRAVPAPDVTNFHLVWPFRNAAAVLAAWQGWAPVGPDELAASLKVTAAGELDQPASVDVYGALLGTESDATELLDELIIGAGSDPIWASAEQMSFSQTRQFWADLGATEDGDGPGLHYPPAQLPYLVAKSEFFSRPLPSEACVALMENFLQDRAPGESRELDFMPWGGAYNRMRPDATAFVHRSELFQLKHSVVIDAAAATREQEAAHRWVARSWALVHPFASGRVFPNFADPDLEDWASAYYGPNYQRLVRIKARYDPAGFFRFHHSLPVR
jgi:FAD/FMN-containing dehydrogenase